MGSIAQAVSTSVASATNSPNTEPAATQAANGPADVTPFRAHDTVDLTETGSRNVSLGQPGANVAAAFQVAYFPPSSSPDARLHGSNSTNAAQAAVSPAVGVRGSSPTAQVASAAAQATHNASVTGASGITKGASLTRQSATNLSPASQAKLAQLNQVLQRLGINPSQISFADRIALLPLVNDPQAVQQFVQGLPQQTAVLNPATSQVSAPSIISNQTSSSPSSENATSPASTSVAAALAASASTTVQIGPSGSLPAEPAHPSSRSNERTGQNVNISV